MGFDAAYEVKRIADEGAFYKKMRMKRRLYRFLGELYVGKRAKLRYFRRWFSDMRMRPGSEVLEVGSGDGVFCFYAARRKDIHVTGLELNSIEARVCQRIVDEDRIRNLKFVEGLLGPQVWDKKFDLIFCLDVLEHVKDDVALMREMFTALKPGGVAMIHVPHRTWTNLDGSIAEIADEDAWKVNPGHVRNGYTTTELEDRLRQAGFTITRTKHVSGWHIVKALSIHEKNSSMPRRLMVLPLLDHHIRKDLRQDQPQGNGVWSWARREEGDGGIVSITVTMLGSGTSAGVPMIGCHCAVCTSCDPRDQRTRPSIVVSYDQNGERHNILVDTTPELRLQAVREGLDRISAVVYTHAHADHIFGLDDVRRYNTIMGKPLPLYAAADTMATLQRTFAYAFAPPPSPTVAPALKDSIYRPELAPVMINGPFDLFGKTWTPIEMVHGRFKVLGFRIGNFAYCTDCNEIPPASRDLLSGLEVLIIDGLHRPHPTHLSFEQAVTLSGELSPPPKRVIFTHVAHDMAHADIEKILPPHVRVGYDGMKFDVG